MISSNYNGSFHFSVSYQFIKCKSGFLAFTLSQPADTRRQSLEGTFLLRQFEPALQRLIVRKHIGNDLISDGNIMRVAAECGPAEGTFAFAKKRTNIGRHKAGEIKCILQSFFL